MSENAEEKLEDTVQINNAKDSDETSSQRPTTVIFNVPDNYVHTKSSRASNTESSLSMRPKTSIKNFTKIKTADLSHISDHKTTNPGKSFIPDEYIREIMTPTPLRPNTGTLNVDQKTWHTTVFPSENAKSIEEVNNLGQWLNQMLKENQNQSSDLFEMATNARHWFTIAYDELCREVSVDCPERAKLLASIWKRYQALFQRVIQLHQEEKHYLIECHKERTTALKAELDNVQAKLKQVSQQYRDDQERWSNAREREETKFANMRKKLDLQIKNKRSLMIQIKALQEQLEAQKEGRNDAQFDIIKSEQLPTQEEKKEPEADEEPVELTPNQVSDRVHQLRSKIRKQLPTMTNMSVTLDDIAHLLDQERPPSKATRELFPSFFYNSISSTHSGKIRSIEWTMACLSHMYARRLTFLSDRRAPYDFCKERTHFLSSIYEEFLVLFSIPQVATDTLFDLIETARGLSNSGNTRCRLFLRFIDAESPYLDSVLLDFYCYCLGSFSISNTSSALIFPDVFDEDAVQFAPLSGHFAIDLAKKVLYSISDADIVEGYIENIRNKLNIELDSTICADDLLELLLEIYQTEEKRVSEQLREQFDMDAAHYGGILSFSQFQTLSMFSSKKFDYRMYPGKMREIFQNITSKTISFPTFIQGLHENILLVPFNFDRIDYDPDKHIDNSFNFLSQQYQFILPTINNYIEKAKKSDDSLLKQLQAANAKLRQAVDTKRAGFFIEVAHREMTELLYSIELE